ncbi:MAG TPA: lipopolysaccharide heptosyltransferase II [Candidatus Binatia bacterium]|jgi:heptosyltransferase-2
MTNTEKILVVQTSFLGDLVLTTPLLAEIRRRFPAAHLAVLCRPRGKDILQGNSDVDEIITYDKRREDGRRTPLRRMVKELRRRRFTLAFSPHKSFRSALLLFLAGIPRRIGFRQSAGWFFFHQRVNRDPTRHDVERTLSLLEPLGVDVRDCAHSLRVESVPGAQQAVARLFHSLGIDGKKLVIGVNPGAVWATKRWTPEGYAELIGRLKHKYDCQVVLFGGPDDRAIVEKIMALSDNAGVSLAGRIGLSELAAAVERCQLFITNDSGPMHVAVARGVPVVAIFCATTPALGFYPYAANAVVVEKELFCRPCGTHGGRRCPLGTEDCMRLIKAEHVMLGVERLIERGSGGNARGSDAYLPQSITV